MHKTFWSMVLMGTMISLATLSESFSIFAHLKMFFLTPMMINNLYPMGMVSDITKIFFLMVILVSLMVLQYSSTYMEHYNNKKFLVLMMLFFVSMTILTASSSWLNLVVGWEILGLSSIFLVMFYPNKTSLYNAMLTMFYNRLGDGLMILMIGWSLLSNNHILILAKGSNYIILLMCLCSLTKSAQFPLSAWLPAAMSAPTPISAMVHSSTLVTAGIFLILMTFSILSNTWMSKVFFFLSLFSFYAGGILANLEKDLKKMIAFSTMSQISMILLFLYASSLNLSKSHMIFHALFKTMLFCSVGLMFSSIYGGQNFAKNFFSVKSNKTMALMILSIFMMTGLMFSLSFYTKDSLLEEEILKNSESMALMVFSGGMLTLMYSSKILSTLKYRSYGNKTMSTKLSFSTFFYFFFILVMMAMFVFKAKNKVTSSSPLSTIELLVVALMVISTLLFFSLKPESKVLTHLSSSVMFMKDLTYSKLTTIMNWLKLTNMLINDHFFFKKKYLYLGNKKEMKLNSYWMYLIGIFVMLTLCF